MLTIRTALHIRHQCQCLVSACVSVQKFNSNATKLSKPVLAMVCGEERNT